MLNMKKGLAIVLAAATVFTFAPVSSLGLTGVVEAEAADTLTPAQCKDANFQNVPNTVYIRDTKDASVTLSPSWVVRKDSNSAENGADLYYQVTDAEPNDTSLLAESFVNTTVSGTTGTTSDTKVLFNTSKKGSVTLTKDAANDTFADGSVYLAAYKLNTADNNYTLVGYKKVNIKTYTNAAYDLRVKETPVNMSLGLDTESGKVEIDKVYNEQGNDTKDASSYSIASVYGTGIQKIDGYISNKTAHASEVNNNTVAVYDGRANKFAPVNAGSTKVTVIAVKSSSTVAVGTLDLEVLGTSQYVIKATVDGTNNSAQIGFKNNTVSGGYSPVVLDVKSNNTYDLASHMYKNNDGIVLSYESNNSKNTVDATTGLVKATTVTDEFVVTVTGKLNGKTVAKTNVYFKVNALPFNQLTVTGADKDQATVLSDVEYAFTSGKVAISSMTEEKLVASQIKYVQIDVTGKETSDPTEALNIVSTSGAIVTASLVGQTTDGAFKGVSNAGVITLNKAKTSGVAVIKLVSNPTTTTALTTSYIYVVVDKADPTIGAADSYKIGTDSSALAFVADKYESEINFQTPDGKTKAKFLKDTDDITAEQNLYAADKQDNFLKNMTNTLSDNTKISVATAESKTMHVLLYYNTGDGTAYKVVTITSVPGVHNSITKIEDATNGKVVYDSAKDSAVAVPELTLDGNTTLKVTIAYSIDKNDTHAGISSTSLYNGNDPLNQNIMTATKDEKKANGYTTFYLYPTTQGTQVVTFSPSGDISATDHSIVKDDPKSLSITYRASKTPSKVTNVKVKNKKGAKVTVTFDEATNHNMKYWVQKKIGKKVAGKSVATNKTTLLVKKGATVKVRVKAYYYDNEGNKHVGKYSSWVTKKTDKK